MKKNISIILKMFAVLILLVSVLFLIYAYPTTVNEHNIGGTVVFKDETIVIELVYINSLAKYYDYKFAYQQGVLSIIVRQSNYFGEYWPHIIEIKNKYRDLKVIEIVGEDGTKRIYPKID